MVFWVLTHYWIYHLWLINGQRSRIYIFFEGGIQMANRHTKKCSTSLTIRKIQIKTTTRYYLMPVRMAGIKKAKNKKCWQKCEEKRPLQHLDFPSGSTVKNLWAMQECYIFGLGRSPGGRVQQPTQVILLGKKSRRQRSLEGYSPWGCSQSETTEHILHYCEVMEPLQNVDGDSLD